MRGDDAPLDEPRRAQLERSIGTMADRALHVLAFAVVEGQHGPDPDPESLRGRATLLGLVGQIDPPRAEAAVAVAACRSAGIRPVMVTGDHKATGLAIGRTLGVAREGDRAVDGRELDALSDDALAEQLDVRTETFTLLAVCEWFNVRRLLRRAPRMAPA